MKKLIYWLLVFVGLAADQIREHGAFAGFGIGILLVPIVFILQLMLARCFGFHHQMPTDDPGSDNDHTDVHQ